MMLEDRAMDVAAEWARHLKRRGKPYSPSIRAKSYREMSQKLFMGDKIKKDTETSGMIARIVQSFSFDRSVYNEIFEED